MATHSPITLARFWTKVRFESEFQCWEWQGKTDEKGYGRFDENIKAHRFSYELFNGPVPDGKMVLHSCDNPPCVNPKHLRPGTHQENMQDAHDRKRFKSPYAYRARVTADQADYIRRNPEGLTLKAIAAKFGIAKSTASYIRSGKTWSPN